MKPEIDYQSRAAYASFIRDYLGQFLGLSLPESFCRRFLRHAQFISGWMDYEDFGAFVLLECHETWPATAADVFRVLDRVRHRLARQTRRQLETTPIEDVASPPEYTAEIASLHERLDKLDAADLLLLNMLVEGTSVSQAAEETGTSVATVYRRLKYIRDQLMHSRGRE